MGASLRMGITRGVLALSLLAGLTGCGSDDSASNETNPLVCEETAASSLHACVQQANAAQRACYLSDGKSCAADDTDLAAALDDVRRQVRAQCAGDSTVQAAGYGPLLTTDALVERLTAECQADALTLAVRTFGGPHGAALAAANPAGRACLEAAHEEAANLMEQALAAHSECIQGGSDGEGCDGEEAATSVAELVTASTDRIASACGNLEELIGLTPSIYATRTVKQSDCLTAAAHPSSGPLALDCGPRDDLIASPPRGEYVQVVLDEATWGSRCGDGSPYAFQIRLAPEGEPIENVLIGMEGGGVCIFEDCADRPADLFEALTDDAPDTGIFSNDPAVSPFANWTKVYLPYCTQDVFIGGGITTVFPSISVHRFGAVDVRAAMRYVRDLLWRELDASTPEGYRPDRIRAFFGGFSAGGFGTIYNYHWMLDDLQWAHTTAYPDAGLALDNGETLGVGNLGFILIGPEGPFGWGARSYLPPYCFAPDCGVGPNILERSSPRLKAVPEQQFLVLSNQVDAVQVGTTFFSSVPDWVNAMRQSYCDTHELPGVRYYLPAVPESIHVISPRPDLFTDRLVDGVTLRDWLTGAVDEPDAVRNRVEEGTLVEDIPGVDPFPCPVSP